MRWKHHCWVVCVRWAAVGGALQCVMFPSISYWGKQARLRGSPCPHERAGVWDSADSNASSIRHPPPKDHIPKTGSFANPILIWLIKCQCHQPQNPGMNSLHVCMHADIDEIEVGFVILIPGNLRLGPINHSQPKRQQIVNKPGHRLISDTFRWSFLESKHRWTDNNALHISLSSCSCLHCSEGLIQSSQGWATIFTLQF